MAKVDAMLAEDANKRKGIGGILSRARWGKELGNKEDLLESVIRREELETLQKKAEKKAKRKKEKDDTAAKVKADKERVKRHERGEYTSSEDEEDDEEDGDGDGDERESVHSDLTDDD
jgi:hypothetical protein